MPSHQDVLDWLTGITEGYIDLSLDNVALAHAALDLVAPLPFVSDQISPHFTLTELTYSDTAIAMGIDNAPNGNAISELSRLANETLEKVREICGNCAVVITSGYRCARLNEEVGGADNSAHLYGCAADFTIPEYGDVGTICRTIEPYLKEFGIDQLIDESGGGARWVHIGRAIPGTAPRHQSFSIP
jgi:hypothetical protein